jgi:uncharacterized protein (UPF0261 family)
MPSVVLLGTLDTKGAEFAFVRERVLAAGCEVILIDAGVRSDPPAGDITADQVAAAAGADRRALASSPDRGAAVAAMARGATEIVRRLHAEGRLDGILGLGGSGGSSLASASMQVLPLGVPKVLVSTMASGDTRPYVGTSDITMMYPVVDIAGINSISEKILTNAAAAIAGMARAAAAFTPTAAPKPRIGATMYGTTTPCVDVARELLEARGYEVLVFHANGTGGRAMESLVRSGLITGVLDITTSELADELTGGILSAGPDRLEAAGRRGRPQVVSVGALEQICFGPPGTVPARFGDRPRYAHNASITLVRPDAAESAAIAGFLARKLNAAAGPLTVFIPLRGFSAYGAPGGPMHDAAADAALVRELKAELRPDVEVVEMATDINDPAFARAMAERLDQLYRAWSGAKAATPGDLS